MNKHNVALPTIFLSFLLLSLTGVLSPVKADNQKQARPNHSVAELTSSVFDAVTLASIIIYGKEMDRDRDKIIQGIDALDRDVEDFIYPKSVYQVISDAETRKKIQQKNKEKLFNSLSVSAQNIYAFSKPCFSPTKMVEHKIISTPVENKQQKKISFLVRFGDCEAAQIVLSEVTNIDGNYYFAEMSASKASSDDKSLLNKNKSSKGIAFQYEVAGLFKSGVAPAKLNGLWGLIDTTGKWLVSPQYKEIGRLSEGVIAVKKAVEKNAKFAFINASLSSPGKEITSFKYNKAHYFSEGLAGVKIGDKWGFIDKIGNLQIPARYTNIRNFKQGFAPVKMGNKWGYINKQGKWLVKPIFNAAYSFTDDGLAVVVSKNKRGFINTQGRFIIKPSYRRVQRFTEGVAPVSKQKNSWFFINKKNKSLFAEKFSKVRNFSEQMTAVMNNQKQWGYINHKGKLIILYEFDKAYDFKEGLALVRKGDKRGFVNKLGEIVIPLIYDDAFRFSEGLAPVKKGELWGYIPNPANTSH